MVEAAQAAAHSKGTYLATQFHHLAARRGAKRAAVAAHSLLVSVFVLLTRQQVQDRASDSQYFAYFDLRDRQAVQRRLVRRLEALGYTVSLEPMSPAACAFAPIIYLHLRL